MENEVTKYYHGRIPQWRFAGAIYFLTFTTKKMDLSSNERKIVFDAVLHWHNKRYIVHSFVVMPDHVHIVCTFGESEEASHLSKIVQSIKTHTARKINKLRGSSGPFWEREFYNRIIRNDEEFDDKMDYVYMNPYRAEITEYPTKYEFYWFNEQFRD